MKIKELSCEQFAGLRDRSVAFENGMNVIVGKNEAGKSSLIDLLYHLFFQDAKLDARRDKIFKEKYFPKTTGFYQADNIDGTVRFETEAGSFKLQKEWESRNGLCKLTTPEGIVRDEFVIRRILDEQLSYGKGIYDEFVFASQRREQNALKALLDGEKEAGVSELSSAVSGAVMETGGIAIDKVEEEIDNIIAGYSGHWDFVMKQPEGGRRRGIENPWLKGVGSITAAFYEAERVRAAKEQTELDEKEQQRCMEDLTREKEKKAELQRKQEAFAAVRGRIEQKKNLAELIRSRKKELEDYENAISDWPKAETDCKKAKQLKEELDAATKKQIFETVSASMTELEKNRKELDGIGTIEEGDVKKAVELENALTRLEAKLAGLNLTAKITKLGTEDITVQVLSTGEKHITSGEELAVTEAVAFQVPGVVDIRLTPKGINAEEIQQEHAKKEEELKEILQRYRAKDTDALKAAQAAAQSLFQKVTILEQRIEMQCGEYSFEQLQQEAASWPEDLRSVKDVGNEIRILCNAGSVDGFLAVRESRLRDYQKLYGTQQALTDLAETKREELENNQKKLNQAETVPPEFAAVEDADSYAYALSKEIKECDNTIEKNLQKIKTIDKPSEEYEEEYQQKLQILDDQIEDCRHWMHIQEVLRQVKEQMKGNPVEDIERAFREYLAMLSDGGLALEGLNEKMKTEIVSGNHPLSMDILSEGTRDTISLAFRLAVLEHLYPEGECVAVFDDPFTDMDPVRTAQACALLQKFAEKNQVIFVTCDEKYLNMLKGNVITLPRN